MISKNMQINENISEYYDNEMSLPKKINLEARMAKSEILSDYCSEIYFNYYKISQSILRVKHKMLIDINSVLF